MITTLSIRRFAACAAALCVAILVGVPVAASAADFVPGEVIVGYTPGANANVAAAVDHLVRTGARAPALGSRVLRLPAGVSVRQAIKRLKREPGVAYAVPNFVAHVDSGWYPNDRGRSRAAGGWQSLQWNFLPGAGVNAPPAWANLIADHHPGGRGVTVAILDTGVAYRNWHQFRRSPDFAGTRFVAPFDFVRNNAFPLDRESHGTFVAGVVAEATNNGLGLTGLAYGASIMPVRVLDSAGSGDAATIARGIVYAVDHGAQVINLSLEFSLDISSADIPDVVSAIQYAHRRGAVVAAAAGNEAVSQIAYPARVPAVISVGATTRDRCLASYSNDGARLDLVAPGGGNDSNLIVDPNCHPFNILPTIHQMTLLDPSNPSRFGLRDGIFGTSMAAPHVSAAAALVIASGVIGRHPTPDAILTRLETTAQHLGTRTPNPDYGFGLVDAGAATSSRASAARHRG